MTICIGEFDSFLGRRVYVTFLNEDEGVSHTSEGRLAVRKLDADTAYVLERSKDVFEAINMDADVYSDEDRTKIIGHVYSQRPSMYRRRKKA